MKLVKGRVRIYSYPKEMSAIRYTEFQKYLASEIGYETVLSSLTRAKSFNQEGCPEDVEIEIENCTTAINSLKEGISILGLAFCVLVAEVDGVAISDTTPDGLAQTLNTISEIGITQEDIENAVEDVKKK